MGIAKDIFLTVLFLPLLVVFLVLTSLKFQVLNADFLPRVLDENNVYPKLDEIIKKEIEKKTLADGGTKAQAKFITRSINPETLEDFIGKNLKNVGNFANGVGEELKVYIPTKSIPKGFFPKEIKLSEEMNFSDLSNLKVNWMSGLGTIVLVLWTIILIVLVVILFTSPWITPIVGGVFTLLVIVAGNVLKAKVDPQTFLGVIAPPILSEFFKIWIYFAFGLVVLGILIKWLKR